MSRVGANPIWGPWLPALLFSTVHLVTLSDVSVSEIPATHSLPHQLHSVDHSHDSLNSFPDSTMYLSFFFSLTIACVSLSLDPHKEFS